MSSLQSIGIIMDGNRRYAKERGMPAFLGHRAGYMKLQEVLHWCKESGIRYMTVYAFSTENWNRSKDEVSYLLELFREMITRVVSDAKKNHTRIIFLGERDRFPQDIYERIISAEEETRNESEFTFAIALSYGGRSEILHAVRQIPKEKIGVITEEEFSKLLWTKDIPDPDLIIRTSGEERLSNFLPWQSVYSELFFTPTYWPAFTKEEFLRMLETYEARQRRFGK